MNLSPKQQQAVQAETSVAIVAGPGSGKTTVLAERYLFHVDPNGQALSPLRVLALSYTNASAAELKRRIMLLAQRRFGQHPKLISELRAAPIMTFHAFCQRVCEENPQAAQVPAVFEIHEESQDPLWWGRLVDRCLAAVDQERLARFGVERLHKVLKVYREDSRSFMRAIQLDHGPIFSEVDRTPNERGEVLRNTPEQERLALQDHQDLRKLMAQLDPLFKQAKWEAKTLEFSDLERHALEALTIPEVAQRYRKRFQACLVDEFQDTSPGQAELLQLISPFFLTIVGDPNQSIYSFRNAEPKLFESMCQVIEQTQGQRVVLDHSYRFHPEVAAGVNRIFPKILASSFNELRAGEGRGAGGVVLAKTLGLNAPEGRRALAAYIVQQIKQIKEQSQGQLDYQDMAVLSRNKGPLSIVEAALVAAGIPCSHLAGGNLLQGHVGRDLTHLLRFLQNPQDDTALVSLLRSPFFGHSDPEIDQLSSRERESIWHYMPNLKGFDGSYEILKALLRAEDRHPAALVRLADAMCGYSAVMAALGAKHGLSKELHDYRELLIWLDEQPNLETALQLLRNHMAEGSAGLTRPPLAAQNAVTLSTIHKAKGLEWPVVLLMDLTNKPKADKPYVLLSKRWGLAIRSDIKESRQYELAKAELSAKNWEEEKRLLFVAATRAKNHLYLTGCEKKGSAFHMWSLLSHLPDALLVKEAEHL